MSCLTQDTHLEKYTYHAKFIELGLITEHNINQIKLINQTIFPIKYGESFYKKCTISSDLCKCAFYKGLIVGNVCCKIISVGGISCLYIMTLGCLPSYRCVGIGSKMLEYVHQLAKDKNIRLIQLHVHTVNNDAVQFYKKRNYTISATVENYYCLLEPKSAFILEKMLD
ncbi:N-acetyltransferase 15 [Intoshia linei]|uniref:N-terminal methionine N(alpha)-acetyltransferase NatE n=1 Tax=Intoshia linei TaxID=1819745 RepID=A0A177BBK7_9BILA|nr:N-acetyltransferase 15 [Intoshia linei]